MLDDPLDHLRDPDASWAARARRGWRAVGLVVGLVVAFYGLAI